MLSLWVRIVIMETGFLQELSFLLWSATLLKRFCLFSYDTYVSDSDQADEAFRAGWREEEEGPDDPVLTGARSFREEFFYSAPLFPDEILIGRMARVVFLHPDLGIGGAERLVVDAALALQAKGHQVTISWGIWYFRHLQKKIVLPLTSCNRIEWYYNNFPKVVNTLIWCLLWAVWSFLFWRNSWR
jgi:hypothetical protein